MAHRASNVSPSPLQLLVGDAGSSPSRSTFRRAVDRGELLRLRPGVFVESLAWLAAPRRLRAAAQMAAIALFRPGTVFCRESALLVHGLPLLRDPGELQIRVAGRGRAGRSRGPAMTGNCPTERLRSVVARAAELGPMDSEALAPILVRRLLPPVPQGQSAEAARREYWTGPAETRAVVRGIPGVLLADSTPATVAVEPAAFALVDTIPQMSRQEAVVCLDAALAGRGEGPADGSVRTRPGELDGAERWLGSRRAQLRWHATRDFADARSESVGESRSRVLIDELGFVAPTLQRRVHLPDGREVRLDFDWEGDGVFGEFDGRVKYDDADRLPASGPAGVYWREKWREDDIELATGRRVVRWRWADLEVPRRLERRLALRGVSRHT